MIAALSVLQCGQEYDCADAHDASLHLHRGLAGSACGRIMSENAWQQHKQQVLQYTTRLTGMGSKLFVLPS